MVGSRPYSIAIWGPFSHLFLRQSQEWNLDSDPACTRWPWRVGLTLTQGDLESIGFKLSTSHSCLPWESIRCYWPITRRKFYQSVAGTNSWKCAKTLSTSVIFLFVRIGSWNWRSESARMCLEVQIESRRWAQEGKTLVGFKDDNYFAGTNANGALVRSTFTLRSCQWCTLCALSPLRSLVLLAFRYRREG